MSQYFQNQSKKGEIYELRTALSSNDINQKKETLKKVIAQMTIGKDVSQLFQPVVKCLEHSDTELKKLVYLYIINYSRKQPDDAIMVINLFRKDALTGSALIKGLAVRTMGCLRVQKLNEYLSEPLIQCLKDKEAYVRKCAAFCVPKLYELSPEIVEQNKLIEILQQMAVSEINVMVLVNVVQALYDIGLLKNENLIKADKNLINRLLTAVNESSEWGQGFILDILSNYMPNDSAHAEEICERIIPRLSHINPNVVFLAIKLLIKYMDYISNEEFIRELNKKISQPLVTMINWEWPEIQYVVLKNMDYILQKRPNILEKQVKCFFCKYYEPYYVKIEKIKILTQLIDSNNYQLILDELKEYVMDPEIEFSKEALKSIGQMGLKISKSIEKIGEILMDLINNSLEQNQSHIIQECVIVLQTILRKEREIREIYDIFFLKIENIMQNCKSSESKQSLVWIIGEYSDKIKESGKIMKEQADQINGLERELQLIVLTAGVKVFINNPIDDSYIQNLLANCTNQSQYYEVRERGNFYWRLLSTNNIPLLKKMLFIKNDIDYEHHTRYNDIFLDKMISNLGTICSIVQKTNQQLFQNQGYIPISQNISNNHKTSQLSQQQQQQQQLQQQQQQQQQQLKPQLSQKVVEEDLIDLI